MDRKVLISSWGGNGGVDAVVDKLMEELKLRGISNSVIYNDPYNNTVRYVSPEEGIDRYFDFDRFLEMIDWSEYSVLDFHSCNFTDEQLKKLKQKAPDAAMIAHVHGLIAHYAHVEAVENSRRDPKSQTAIDLDWMGMQPDSEMRIRDYFTAWDCCKFQESILSMADRLVFLTDFTRDAYRRWYPSHDHNDSKEKIIGNGSDFSKYAKDPSVLRDAECIRASLGGKDAKIIMYSGRITKPKGASDLAKAFDRIKEQYPEAKLLLVGEASEDEGGMKCVTDHVRKVFQKDIITTGWVKDKKKLAAYYKAADVLAIPSYHETFSISALEGMFMGTPVIMGDVDGSHEVYVKPCLAYGTAPGDIDRMIHLFNYLFEDPTRARENATYVQSVVNQKYNMDTIINQTLEVYNEELLKKAGVGPGDAKNPNNAN